MESKFIKNFNSNLFMNLEINWKMFRISIVLLSEIFRKKFFHDHYLTFYICTSSLLVDITICQMWCKRSDNSN